MGKRWTKKYLKQNINTEAKCVISFNLIIRSPNLDPLHRFGVAITLFKDDLVGEKICHGFRKVIFQILKLKSIFYAHF